MGTSVLGSLLNLKKLNEQIRCYSEGGRSSYCICILSSLAFCTKILQDKLLGLKSRAFPILSIGFANRIRFKILEVCCCKGQKTPTNRSTSRPFRKTE
ncbi:hypothetical protein CEXT_203031 [Caerostris extrusa]|uniref:Uncharacterized protein n=1 Tax=Caerostris extrusa TaxID=172846 RepID=A0AAV4NTW1_CAEEX|nr:hypothetical protein CEXT_203031 [Caerostris extrusa]